MLGIHSICASALAALPPAPAAATPPDGLTLESVRAIAARIQDEIEGLRGLEFQSPVRVELTDAEAFVAYARKHLEADGGLERLASDERAAKLLGLLADDVDLLELSLEVLAEQVGGFYDARADAFYILENVDPLLAEIVIAHEFTHALDDQHHDLDGASRARAANGDALLAHHALVEGSGMEIMTQWAMHHLGFERLGELAGVQDKMPVEAISKAPPYVWKPLIAIYLQGQAFLRKQARLGLTGHATADDIERAFADPPRSTEQVLHPEKYWDPAALDLPRAVSCRAGELPRGWTLEREDTLGELLCALVVEPHAERGGMQSDPFALLKLRFTSDAAAGWAGDRYGLLSDGATASVLRLYSVWDTTQDAEEFAAALHLVAPQAPPAAGGPATRGWRVERTSDDVVILTSWRGVEEAVAVRLAGALEFGAEAEVSQSSR